MAKKFLTNIDLVGNQLLNAVIQNLATAPTSPAAGLVYYDTTKNAFGYYNGTAWVYAVNGVLTVAAGNNTITIAGTAANPTIAVAKTLDHTYITDFQTTVDATPLSSLAVPTATVSFNGQLLTGLANAANATDAVNLQTLQTYINQLTAKADVAYATAAALPSNAYSSTALTLTGSASAALSVDGVAVAVGQRILVKNEATSANNGIYTVTATGSSTAAYVLTRAADMNTSADFGPGLLVPTEAPTGSTAGTTNNNVVFLSIAPSPFTLGTSGTTFTQVGNTYAAGTGLTLTGNTFSITAPIPLSLGGTGATTASGARTNLGATGKYAVTFGDGTTTAYTITHSLNTQDVTVSVYDTTAFAEVECDVAHSTVNTLTLTFNVAPASNTYRATVIG